MTAAEIIAALDKLPKDIPIYFDCWHCGAAQGFREIAILALVKTQQPKPERTP